MEPKLVIKVKYGETLRRFHVLLLACRFGLDMDGLRAKICSLFNLPSNSELKTTYIDEDGDVVTMVGDDDLYDIVGQKLKFLRIDVELSDKMTKNPGLDSRDGELEQNGCFSSNDGIQGTPFLASKVENGEEGSSRNANLLDKLPKTCERFPATLAASTSSDSQPVALNKKLPAFSVKASPAFSAKASAKASVGFHFASFHVDKWGAALDDLEEMEFHDRPMVERLLKKNDGNMRRTFLGLLAWEKA